MSMFNSFNSATKAATPQLATAAIADRKYNTQKDASDLKLLTDTASGAISLFNPVIGAGMKLLTDRIAGSGDGGGGGIDNIGSLGEAGGQSLNNVDFSNFGESLNTDLGTPAQQPPMQAALRSFNTPQTPMADPFNYKF